MRIVRLVLAAVLASVVIVSAADHSQALETSSIDILGPAGSGTFGNEVLVLTNGNFVVVDELFDAPGAVDAGAVYLYNGATRALIARLVGSTAGDKVGLDGVVEVGDSNFVVLSSQWHNSAVVNAGASTWVSGIGGLNAAVSAGNSLVGSTANDLVGREGAIRLTNGNYVVSSTQWLNGAYSQAGAVTWGSGNGGVVGPVSVSNSLVGAFITDLVGSGGITALSNGNYVVSSPGVKNTVSNALGAGAATWGSGNGGTVGPVTAGNSIIGGSANDAVSSGRIFALTNGNYVIDSPEWDAIGGVVTEVGAATWGNGTVGTVGGISISNSLTSNTAGDRIGAAGTGIPGITALTNGNYVVISSSVNGFSGAATWANGNGSTVGQVTSGNSLVGPTGSDRVGSRGVFALANGNYVINSKDWSGGGPGQAGAVTWASGSGATTGFVTSANSLVGTTAADGIGQFGTAALTNGNYVVVSPLWDNGGIVNAGAATWGNGAGGTVGSVAVGNSFVGTATSDSVSSGSVTALTNGNYVIDSPLWNSSDLGAVTWGNGATGLVGSPSAGNSLVGTTASDVVGTGGVTPLPNGNYTVGSVTWDSPTLVNPGAVTLGSGAGGLVGAISAANSVVGSTANDQMGGIVVALANSGYLVKTTGYDNGATVDAGAVTFGGLAGVQGTVNSFNSVRGVIANDIDSVGNRFVTIGAVPVSRVARNIVTLFLIAATPPSFPTVPPNLNRVTSPGATSVVVAYANPVATDNIGLPSVTCAPASGSTLPIGATVVSCTATNTANLTASTSFTVTVSAGHDFVPLPPARLADTRPTFTTADGLFAGGGLVSAGSTLALNVGGRGGVPINALAAALNVTVTEPGAAGFVTAYPCDRPQPTASNLNYTAGVSIPNAVISQLSETGTVCLFVSQALHLVVDVNGYFPVESFYQPLNPARILETRAGLTTIDGLQQGSGQVAAGSITTLAVTGRPGVPAGIAAVALNVTVTEPNRAGYATVYPCGTPPPLASNLNYTSGLTIPNLVISKLGPAGTVCIFTQEGTHLVADVDGYFPAGTTYTALDPARLLDTRPGMSTVDGVSAGAGLRTLGTVTVLHVAGRGGVPAAATTAVLNVTVTGPGAAGYVTVYPCGIDPPLASNLNFVADQTVPNAVITKIGVGGDVCLFNSQATHLVVDVNGSFP